MTRTASSWQSRYAAHKLAGEIFKPIARPSPRPYPPFHWARQRAALSQLYRRIERQYNADNAQ